MLEKKFRGIMNMVSSMNKIKQFLHWIGENQYWKHILIWMGMGFSLLVIDVMLRYFSNQYVMAYRFTHASPLFFSISWILLFMGICYLLPKKGRMILYTIGTVAFNILAVAQILHMKVLNRFFGLSDLFLAGEGSDYFLFAIKKIDWFTIGMVVISLSAMGITLFLMKRTKEFPRNRYYYLIVLLVTILLVSSFRFLAIKRLGEAAEDSKSWEAAYNVKNIYLDFNNQSKNMEVAGLYEQTFRNSYLYIKSLFNVEKEKIGQELDAYFEEQGLTLSKKNSYTAKLKGQNLIIVLMESIDSWLVNEEVMPTLTKLQKEGLNFTNRYAPTFGGGMTINSEYAVNTGLYAIPNSKAIYNFDANYYPYSLANMFLNEGYTAVSVHANTAKFYNRANFHRALGYTHHYALTDEKELDQSYNYFLDSSLIKNPQVADIIVREEPFLTFITTYSAHLPYDNENPSCQELSGLEVEGNKELSCIRNLAHDTDEFLRLLLEKLEEKGELDNTTLVLFSDHYMYGYSDLDYMMKEKGVDDTNLVQQVPLVIWSNSLKKKQVNTIMDTADILPTILNLFGIEYTTNYYVGTDVFSKEHEKFVYFDNTTFYDGELYYNDRKKRTEENQDYIDETLNTIQEKMTTNDQIILGNYFQYLEEKDSE